MNLSATKPLPEIKPSPILRRLTIDSDALITTLIQRSVDEEGLDSSWTDAIKSALADLGEYVALGEIFPGLKATRQARNRVRALAAAAARAKEQDRAKEPKTGRSKGIEKVEATESVTLNLQEEMDVKLKEIHALTSQVSIPALTTTPKHLLLTIAPSSDAIYEQDTTFDIVPASRACIFKAETYSLPFYRDEHGQHGQGGVVICGLDNWTLGNCVDRLRIVGGMFTLRNLTSATAYKSLTSVLKIAIYAYMSLVLEQYLLSKLRVTLHYPTFSSTTSALERFPAISDSAPSRTPRKLHSTKPSAIWSFLSKKTEGIIHRVAGTHLGRADSVLHRHTSLDGDSVSLSSSWHTPRSSEESIRAEFSPSETAFESDTIKASRARVIDEEDRRDRERFGPFMSTVRRIQDKHCILSTSPKLVFPLPPLIVQLAQREEQKHGVDVSASSLQSGPPSLRLTGVEKTGLSSILGWEGRDGRGRDMAGVRSFVRHQGITVLYTEYTKLGKDVRACGRPRFVTYRYWGSNAAADAEGDQILGELIERLCGDEDKTRCEIEGCDKPRHMHSVSWTCNGVKIGAVVKERREGVESGDGIDMWQACDLCGQSTDPTKMDDASYLFSFAKLLELLIWSPLWTSLPLCEHITSLLPGITQPDDSSRLSSRFHILLHFAHKHRILTFSLTSVHGDVYEIRLPKLQPVSGPVPKEEKHLSEARKKREDEEDRRTLTAEIGEWWQGVNNRLDKLDAYLKGEALKALESKDLPPLPASEDEASEDETASKPIHPSSKRPQMSRLVSFQQSLMPLLSEQHVNRKPAAPYPPVLPTSSQQSQKLLRQLRESFQLVEDAIRKQVQETPISSLNDVRQSFRSTSRGSFKRLVAWQKKHAPGAPAQLLAPDNLAAEPEWWGGNCHLVPGSHVVVREGEWGSIIAFTLSSLDYQRELAHLHMASGSSSSTSPAIGSSPDLHLLSPNATIKPIKSIIQNPDPDVNDSAPWEESEICTTVITRREHPREASSLLSLRDVLRTKHSFDSTSLGSRFSKTLSRGVTNFTPPAAWTQPQVRVNLAAAGGQVTHFPEASEGVEKVLESQYPAHHHTETDSDSFSNPGEATPPPSSFVAKHIRIGGRSTFLPLGDTPGKDAMENDFAPSAVPKPIAANSPVLVPGSVDHRGTPSGGSFSSAILSNALRYFLNTGPPSRAPSPVQSGTHHGLLAFDTTSSIDDRPHIKYEWTIGKRLKFSCTVYYAKQFDALRKRCGVDDIVIKSLERSEHWTAVGGKSKSNFWKSSDDRFIIKTLVNAWNVADLQVLIELGPSYFHYIDSTASKASVLAKLMGFYTIEIKNLETGSIQAKYDLLVMENLFYNQNVTKAFDLKGIQSRRVKPNTDGMERRPLYDGEWIESQQRAPLLIQPHSGHILREAIKADADFLAKSNIMDYSLLLGIDQERHEIACGLVDTIGSYTFAKTLEYKAKQNLNSGKGKEITVIPPAEYHDRFVNSMGGYFLVCPDKWTKPPDFIDRIRADDLPSVV